LKNRFLIRSKDGAVRNESVGYTPSDRFEIQHARQRSYATQQPSFEFHLSRTGSFPLTSHAIFEEELLPGKFFSNVEAKIFVLDSQRVDFSRSVAENLIPFCGMCHCLYFDVV
jgi:hypothetical protein